MDPSGAGEAAKKVIKAVILANHDDHLLDRAAQVTAVSIPRRSGWTAGTGNEKERQARGQSDSGHRKKAKG